jgi:hypothetical protein
MSHRCGFLKPLLHRHHAYWEKSLEQVKEFFKTLPPRRQAVARLAALGMSNTEIAHERCIQPIVVAEHLNKIFPLFGEYVRIPEDRNTRRYRLIHYLTRLFEQYPDLLLEPTSHGKNCPIKVRQLSNTVPRRVLPQKCPA